MSFEVTNTNKVSDSYTLFKKHFGCVPVHTVKAPGRLEVLGNHTDYNDGLVMAAAIDRYVFMSASPRADGKVEIISSAVKQPEIFPVNDIKSNPSAIWANYVKGVLVQLRKRGVHYSGFNVAIHSTVPIGAGMSSSAALEVATALMVRKLFPYALTVTGLGTAPRSGKRGELPTLNQIERMEFAKLCRAAENEFVGVPCGILDQVSSLFGTTGNIMLLDCRALTVETVPLAGSVFIVCNTGVKHALIGGEYAELRQNCEAAARKLGAKFLRTVDIKQVQAAKDQLSQREFECALHVVSEIARVVAGEHALRQDDHAQFGQYMFQSHESSRNFLRNSCKELDVLVELARKHPACLGARLTGGGFGGATINLVAHHRAQEFKEYMVRECARQAGIMIAPVICQIVDGADDFVPMAAMIPQISSRLHDSQVLPIVGA